MKKSFLFTMFVMLMTSISSFAQKEYNMVITLSNGTTVTLGHNDIKEITFNDGDVAISGNMVNTIDSLAQVTCDLNAAILRNDVYDLDQDDRLMKVAEMTDKNFSYIANAVDEKFAAYDNALSSIAEFVEQQADLNNQVQKEVTELFNLIAALHPEIAETSEYKKAKAAVTTMKNNAVKIPALKKTTLPTLNKIK